MLQLSSNGSDILTFLSVAEQSDPELVGFWATAASQLEQKEADCPDDNMRTTGCHSHGTHSPRHLRVVVRRMEIRRVDRLIKGLTCAARPRVTPGSV